MNKYLKYIALLALLVGAIGYKVYNKPHQNIVTASTDVQIKALDLFNAFEQDEQKANDRFLDKVIEVSGTVKEIKEEDGKTSLVLETGDLLFGIICQLDDLTQHKRTNFQIGETIKLKGLCTGKLMDVVMVRCVES